MALSPTLQSNALKQYLSGNAMKSLCTQAKKALKSCLKACCPPPIRKSLSTYLYKYRADRAFERIYLARKVAPPLAFLPRLSHLPSSPHATQARKIRVLFYNDWGNSWETLEPLALALSGDPAFEVIVLAMPSRVESSAFYDLNASLSTQSFAQKVQTQAILVQDILDSSDLDSSLARAKSLHAAKLAQWLESTLATNSKPLCLIGFDTALNAPITPQDLAAHYCFTTRPYDSLRPAAWSNPRIAQISKLCYIEYGVYMFSSFDEISAYDYRLLRFYDYYFAPTPFHAKLSASKQGAKSLLRIMLSGSAYFERLISLASHKPHAKPLRVLYVPRWAAQDTHSTFSRYIEPLIEAAKQGHFRLHFRPHPNMYDHLVESNLLSKQQWQGIKDCVEKYGFWDTRPSIMESFSDSDIIISDTSSMLIYAFLSGKPTIYTQGDDMAEICAWALRVAQGVFIATSKQELLQVLRDLCANLQQAFMSKIISRDWILQQNFYFPKGGASAIIRDSILSDMSQTSPQAKALDKDFKHLESVLCPTDLPPQYIRIKR